MRSDIDGLRAIAIISAILYHAFPEKCESGLISVDIFFVISGFLITRILLKSIDENKFSYFEFYKNRVLRLFPSVIFMLLIFGTLGFIYFLPPEMEYFGKHLRAGSLFTNFSLFHEADYFSKGAQSNPLLHFWSLGVEEQFYFLWPLLLFLTHRKKIFIHLLLVLFGASLTLNLLRVETHPAEIYYLLHGRLWELLSGCILAWYLRKRRNVLPVRFRNVLSFSGFILLGVSFFSVSSQGFPGWQAILPVFATVMIILGDEDAWINKHLLSHDVMSYVARISYPLYLWHWPLMVFFRKMSLSENNIYVALLFSFLFAAFSYHFLEKPLRSASLSVRKKMFWGLCTLMILISASGQVFYLGMVKPVNTNPEMEKFVRASREKVYLAADYKPVYEQGLEGRVFGSGKEKILLLGDCHLQMHLPYFLEKMDLKKYTFYDFSQPGCTFFYLSNQSENCKRTISASFDIANKAGFSKVVIIYFWSVFLTKKGIIQRDSQYFERLNSFKKNLQSLSMNRNVYVIEGTPNGKEFDPLYIIRNRGNKPATFNLKRYEDKMKFLNNDLKIITESSGAKFIKSMHSICPQNRCDVMYHGEPAYRNSSHLRRFFVLEKARYLDLIFKDNR